MKRVLSIQSHVVFGYVGNKAATLPLQLLGYDVDPLNTVMLSNHTGYPVFKGSRINSTELWNTFEGLKQNKLINYSHILVGYLGNSELVHTVKDIIAQVKLFNPKVIIVIDPVMGDDDKLYVPKELVPKYKLELCPLADVITPNQTEIEHLTDIKIESILDLKSAFTQLHSSGIKNIVITSSKLNLNTNSNQMHLFGSTENSVFSIEFSKKAGEFSGTGDLFSSLLLARFDGQNLKQACLKALASLQAVLEKTIEKPFKTELKEGEGGYEEIQYELRLIDSIKEIMEPKEKDGDFIIKEL
ncbi:pyridoxal kinase [Neoconidiobolus thromboides FSU 785]|nr:pyridoxal kinase [Neoconidiobolus thromboides FSU 785]